MQLDFPSQDMDHARLRRMKRLATGLLLLMAVLYAFARSYQEHYPALAWARAFAEAAMVGALADWFAVTALFRHPLGLPIPHTSIISREKDRIGALIARFLRGNFLTPEVLGGYLVELRLLPRAAAWLAQPENAARACRRLSGLLGPTLRDLRRAGLLGDAAQLLRHALERLPLVNGLQILTQSLLTHPSRRELLAPLLSQAANALHSHRDFFLQQAREEAPLREHKILGGISRLAATAFSGHAVHRLVRKLHAASQDLQHPLYGQIETALARTLEELADDQDPATPHPWADFQQRLLTDPQTLPFLEKTLRAAFHLLREELLTSPPGRPGNPPLAQSLSKLATRLRDNPQQLQVLEKQLEAHLATVLERYGHTAEALVRRTVAQWPAETLIEKLELHLGPDLQFIRINGTLIGGTVGLLLHAISLLIWGG